MSFFVSRLFTVQHLRSFTFGNEELRNVERDIQFKIQAKAGLFKGGNRCHGPKGICLFRTGVKLRLPGLNLAFFHWEAMQWQNRSASGKFPKTS